VYLDDPTAGVAVWIQPQWAEVRSRATQEKHEFLKRTLSGVGYDNYRRILDFMSANSQRLVDTEAWYLSILAVAPAKQRAWHAESTRRRLWPEEFPSIIDGGLTRRAPV
jgi:hypothetical protein